MLTSPCCCLCPVSSSLFSEGAFVLSEMAGWERGFRSPHQVWINNISLKKMYVFTYYMLVYLLYGWAYVYLFFLSYTWDVLSYFKLYCIYYVCMYVFEPLPISQVWPLAKKYVIYNCNSRYILTVRNRISTKKSRKLHFITFMT